MTGPLRRAGALCALALLLAQAAVPARAAEPPVDDAAAFSGVILSHHLASGGFTVRFEGSGPGGYRGAGEIAFAPPFKVRIDTDAAGVPLAWVKNGPRVFLAIDGADGHLFHLPAAAHETSRIGPLPDTPEGLKHALAALLHARGARVTRDDDGYEIAGATPASRESFRLLLTRDLAPRALVTTTGDRVAWDLRFSAFRSGAPATGLFEPNARKVFDLYR